VKYVIDWVYMEESKKAPISMSQSWPVADNKYSNKVKCIEEGKPLDDGQFFHVNTF
jgi:hypothetical protein